MAMNVRLLAAEDSLTPTNMTLVITGTTWKASPPAWGFPREGTLEKNGSAGLKAVSGGKTVCFLYTLTLASASGSSGKFNADGLAEPVGGTWTVTGVSRSRE